jgi:membrane-associated phospholipid phosphatase
MTTTARGHWLRSSLLASVPLSAALFVLCGLIEIVAAHQVWRWDERVVLRVATWGVNAIDPLMAGLTAIGGGTGRALLTGAAVAALRLRGRRVDGWFLVAGVAGASLIGRLLKDVLERPRPLVPTSNDYRSVATAMILTVVGAGLLACCTRWRRASATVVVWFLALVAVDRGLGALIAVDTGRDAFPSGHATGSMALAAGLVVLAWPSRHRWLVVAGCAVFVAGVGLSRLHYGVHRPTELVAGWCVAVVWLTVLTSLRRFDAARTLERWAVSLPLAVGSALIPLAL